ncbi:cardiolipin synthase [Bacilli bacterium PM5-3]|nr:cardiolipin synthase [Bacilli bacterium PM5-3]
MKRIVLLVIWAIFQIVLFFYLLFVPAYTSIAYPLLILLGIIMALAIQADDTKLTTSKLSWITIVLAVPIIGVVLYLVFGQGHMSTYRMKILEDSRLKFSKGKRHEADISKLDADQKSLVDYLDKANYRTSYLHNGGNITCYTYGREKFDQLIVDIKEAKKYIHIEYYIIKAGKLYDEIIEVLIQKAREGVEVRMMSDYVGGRTLSAPMIKRLRDNGIKFAFFNELKVNVLSKISNFRDHRKIAVIDGRIAYTGGFNIGDEYIDLDSYYGHWEDFHIRICDSSAVLEYETFFGQTWYFETKENLFKKKYYPEYDKAHENSDTLIYPFVDGPDTVETFIRDMFLKSIMSAKKKIWIATPYLIPDAVLFDALIVQANAGVEIAFVTPGLPDKKYVKLATESYYPDLIKAGVKIYEYNGFVHAKKLLVDDKSAIVGTANFDMRSFNLSFEVCTLVMGGKVINDISDTFLAEFEDAKLVTLEKVENRSALKKLSQVVIRLFAPLF